MPVISPVSVDVTRVLVASGLVEMAVLKVLEKGGSTNVVDISASVLVALPVLAVEVREVRVGWVSGGNVTAPVPSGGNIIVAVTIPLLGRTA